jgi:HTH-type transcriptional regulator/antitoxin HigA
MTITIEDYTKANIRLNELIDLVNDETSENDPIMVEFLKISEMIENYEKEHFPIDYPDLKEVIRLRMFELRLKQKDLSVLLGVSSTRVSEYLSGKRPITLDVAKSLHKKLNIDAEIILQ